MNKQVSKQQWNKTTHLVKTLTNYMISAYQQRETSKIGLQCRPDPYMHSSYMPKYIGSCQHAWWKKRWIIVGKKLCIRVTVVSSVDQSWSHLWTKAQTASNVGDCDMRGSRPRKAPHERMLKTDNPLFNKHMHTEPNIIYGTENDCT
jgi:hypothetical protein